jgi:hypothetical protein
MYEHKTQPLLPRRLFIARVVRHAILSFSILSISLGIGILGYHNLEGLPWIDALLNASMILGGMGPVDKISTDVGKIFASVYAIFSGVIFLASAGIVTAPIAHRILHRLHLVEQETNS